MRVFVSTGEGTGRRVEMDVEPRGTTVAMLLGLGGVKAVVAQNLLLKQQLLNVRTGPEQYC